MKFAVGITFYFPNIDEIEKALLYTKICEQVFIFDNTDKLSVDYEMSLVEIKNCSNIEYISFKENKGLSYAYNHMCNQAINQNFNYICLLDQDSKFSDIISAFDIIKENDKGKTAIWAPRLICVGKEKQHYFNTNLSKVNSVISSGSFINLEIFQHVGGFDENYFIDRVDTDYCKACGGKNFEIVQINSVFLLQRLGEISKTGRYEHNPIRNYYIYRNRLYFYRKHHSKSIILKIKLFLICQRHKLRILLYETKKMEKLKMIAKAKHDYKENRFGKIVF